MLSELRIRNFALIDALSVPLGPGLNVLTGETGAGKSIIVGALSLLLGERSSAGVVRTGAERATVEGVFEVKGREELARFLDQHGVELADGLLVLKREVAAEGRSRAWINGSPTTATLLGEVGGMLVDLHGQHEHQTLLRRDEQRAILDAYGENRALAGEVAAAHARRSAAARAMEVCAARLRESAQRADFLRFQLAEIDGAALRSGEDEELDAEASRLSHAEDLTALSLALHRELGGGDGALAGRLGALRRTVDQLIRIDPSQNPLEELYDTAYYAVEELAERMEAYARSVDHDPERLEEIRRRQELIYRLSARYGPTLADVLETGRSAGEELALLEGGVDDERALQDEAREAGEALTRLSGELTERRGRSMKSLATEVGAVLPELGMSGGIFQVVRLPLAEPGPHGAEEVEFRVSVNRGFDPRPLAQVASGGELSRVMLAIKTILARLDSVPTLVFDEVDAGIGGRVALRVGEKMREVAAQHQVFAITHLPQIASRADHHFLVTKDERGGLTATEVRELGRDERVEEIARMLGGDPESEVSLEHARELLAAVG